MKTINYEIEIVDANCTGCFRCERACPTEAITMVGPRKKALAVVDNSLCIACMRCIDACDDDAMFAKERDEPLQIGFDMTGVQVDDVVALCHAAAIDPKQSVCWCSGSTAQEVAATILSGATSFEALALITGVQSGCLMYCSVPLRRLLTAHDGESESSSKVRRYPSDQGLLDIPAELADAYPLFGIEPEQTLTKARIERDRQRRAAAQEVVR